MADLFDGHALGQQWDEVFAQLGQPRPAYGGLHAALQSMAEGGVFSGPGSDGHTVTVEVTRLA